MTVEYRIGTPYVTSRGMMTEQMQAIGGLMAEVLHNLENDTLIQKTKAQVQALCDDFPLYPQSNGDER